LKRALASVAAQTHPAGEVIVVDDESTDGTADYLASRPGGVRPLRTRGGSPGGARNAGAAAATGEYLAFLDSDDLWMPWTLEAFAAAIAAHARPALVAASFRQFADERELGGERRAELVVDASRDYLSSWPRTDIVGAGMMAVRRDVFAGAGGFRADQINLEDHDFMLRIGTAPGFVIVRSPLMLGWRRHEKNVTREMARSVAGCDALLAAEARGEYPGGAARAPQRRGIVTMHARAVSIECARAGLVREAGRIYLATLRWHVALRRWKYLATFPLVLLAAMLRPRQA
jgi:hypothetical protein